MQTVAERRPGGQRTCCIAVPHEERGHFAGSSSQLGALLDVAAEVRAEVVDVRGEAAARQLLMLRALHAEAVSRVQAGGMLPMRVLAIDRTLLTDPLAVQLMKDVAGVRRLGLHLWIESDTGIPRRLAVELERRYCVECTVACIIECVRTGTLL